VLFLPDRQTNLDFINDIATGLERLVTVRRGNADPDRAFTNLEQAHAMHASRIEIWKLHPGFRQYFLTFGDRQRRIGLVLEALDDVPLILIANPAFECAITARGRINQGLLQPGRIDR
jgi:hypothetical protein